MTRVARLLLLAGLCSCDSTKTQFAFGGEWRTQGVHDAGTWISFLSLHQYGPLVVGYRVDSILFEGSSVVAFKTLRAQVSGNSLTGTFTAQGDTKSGAIVSLVPLVGQYGAYARTATQQTGAAANLLGTFHLKRLAGLPLGGGCTNNFFPIGSVMLRTSTFAFDTATGQVSRNEFVVRDSQCTTAGPDSTMLTGSHAFARVDDMLIINRSLNLDSWSDTAWVRGDTITMFRREQVGPWRGPFTYVRQ